MGPRQRPWLNALQKRISLISSVLRNVKAIRMMGISDIIESEIQDARVTELRLSKHFRWMIVWINMVGKSWRWED